MLCAAICHCNSVIELIRLLARGRPSLATSLRFEGALNVDVTLSRFHMHALAQWRRPTTYSRTSLSLSRNLSLPVSPRHDGTLYVHVPYVQTNWSLPAHRPHALQLRAVIPAEKAYLAQCRWQ